MGYIIEVSEHKVENLAEKVGKMLCLGNQVMECINEMAMGESYMGERGSYGERDDYDDPDYEHGVPEHMMQRMGRRAGSMGYRRGRSSSGRYTSM